MQSTLSEVEQCRQRTSAPCVWLTMIDPLTNTIVTVNPGIFLGCCQCFQCGMGAARASTHSTWRASVLRPLGLAPGKP